MGVKMFLAFLAFLSVVIFVQGRTECYDIGCATDDPPFNRWLAMFPQSPESIGTRFLLFTKNNTDQYQVVSARNLSSIKESNFDCKRKTVFIVHGYLEHGYDPWLVELCKTILEKEDLNCVCVDWSGGSFALYTVAMNNVQVVGAEIAFFINKTLENFNCSLSRIILIGHSLGGQVVGEAGKRRQGIAILIGLDAARPGFEGQPKNVTVDRSDALFVLAVHTDKGLIGLGVGEPYGHKNFYPNGGELQTGCAGSQITDLGAATSLVGAARDVALCNHVTSYYMFIDTIRNPEGFVGYCAPDYKSFQKGAGFPCSNGSCSMMGFYTKPDNMSSCRVYYLNTGPRFDYPRWRYNVTVRTGGTANNLGSISITLYNSTDPDVSDEQKINSGSVVGGSTYSALIDSVIAPPIVRVTVNWSYLVPLILDTNLIVESVDVTTGINGNVSRFCVDKTTKENNPQTLHLCA